MTANFDIPGEGTHSQAVNGELKITFEQRLGTDGLSARASRCGQFIARVAPSCTRHVSQQEQLVGNCWHVQSLTQTPNTPTH